MMLRRIARPMLAAWFVTEGSAAVRGSAAHLEPARAGVDALAEQIGFTRPDDAGLRTIVKVHGGLTIAAGLALALGKAPRLAAVVLAALTFPSVVANLVASRRGTTSEEVKAEQQQRAVRALSFTGAALIAAADREGRPGLAWKMSHAKQLAAAGAVSGVAGLGKGGAKVAATTGKASAAAGAKAVKHAKEAEVAAVELTGKAAKKAAKTAAATAGAAAAAGSAGGSTSDRPKRSQVRAERKALRVTERENARAVKVAAAQAAQAEKAAKVAERAEAAASKVSRRTRRAEARAAKHATVDVEDVVVVA